MAKRIDRADPGLGEGLVHNPFAALRPGGDKAEPAAEPKAAESEAEAAEPPAGPAAGARLVVRREKRGRAGKTVTRVTGLEGDDGALQALARQMKRALGCGAAVEDRSIVLQGALTDRAAAWLRETLSARVTIGN